MTLDSDAKFQEKWLVVWKMAWEIGKILPEHTKVSRLGLLLGHFIQSRKCMSLKFAGELYFMTMTNDAKFEKGLTSHFKNDMSNLMNFDPNPRKSQKFSP